MKLSITSALLAFYAFGPSSTAFAPATHGSRSSMKLQALGSNNNDSKSPYYTSDSSKSTGVPPYTFDMQTPKSMMASAGGEQNTRKLQDRLQYLEKELEGKGRRVGSNNRDDKYWDMQQKVYVQGGSLKTWSYASPAVDAVQVRLQTEGRPLDASVDLWQGPDNTPQRIRVYLEDGLKRPFNCVMVTPRGPNTIAIRNTGQLEFPFLAACSADVGTETGPMSIPTRANGPPPLTIQGGALRTYPFDAMVDSVQVLLRTDGRPLNARIELLQGPNNNKQVIEVYTEDGLDRPFYVVMETPGSGNVVRIVNISPVEFPMTALVEAYSMADPKKMSQAVLGGDSSRDNLLWQG